MVTWSAFTSTQRRGGRLNEERSTRLADQQTELANNKHSCEKYRGSHYVQLVMCFLTKILVLVTSE